MFVKKIGERHFTKKFKGGSFSDRVILPGRDPSRVKVTKFTGAYGEKFDGVSNPIDETVIVHRGVLKIEHGGATYHVGGGDMYHVPAGETYSVEILVETEATCIFSQAADGTLPENEKK